MAVNPDQDNVGDDVDMADGEDPIDAYRQSLSELVLNSKPHIVVLTMLAEESKDTRAAEIVQCIEERLYQVDKEVQLPTLYLIDSICKNVSNSSYIQLFEKRIIKLFFHVFEQSDEETRVLMYKLRKTWNNYFSTEILYNLDLSVKKLDPGWPITVKKIPPNSSASQNGQHKHKEATMTTATTVKPVVIPVNKSQTISTTPPVPKPIETKMDQQRATSIIKTDSSKQQSGTAHPTIILVNQSEIISKRNQIEHELRKELINKSTRSNVESFVGHKNPNSNHINKLNKIEQRTNKSNEPLKISKTNIKVERKRKNSDENKVSTILAHMDIGGNGKGGISGISKKIKTKIPKRKQPLSSPTSGHSSNKQSKKNHPEDVIVPMIAPDDVIPLGRDHHVSVTKRLKETRIPRTNNDNVLKIKNIKNRRLSPPNRNRRGSSPSSSAIVGRNHISPTKSISTTSDNKKPSTPSTIQTTIPAPNIFSQPELFISFNTGTSMENNSPSQTVASNQSPSFCMDRDYRREFDTIMNDAQKQLNAGAISSADHEILIREAERQFYELQQQQNHHQPNVTVASQIVATNAALQPPTTLVQPQQQPFPSPPAAPVAPVNPQFNPLLPSSIQSSASSNQPFSSNLIEPPHGSAAIYINKEFCRLFYLDHITGIVLFKTHPDTPFDHLVSMDPVFLEPKQVYFSGHPTKVIIDPGTPNEQSFCLKFNDPVPLMFTLPGVHAPQRIMLGLPDRELIINDRPYKAQFGGAPLSVYMECDHQTHLFYLSDSRPFLQLSDEPRYDLWNRLVSEAKAKMQQVTAVQNQQPTPFTYGTTLPTINVSTGMTMPLSSNVPISSATYINNPIQQVDPTVEPPPPPSAPFNSLPSIDSKPIPDLNSLLYKLTAVGLINNKNATSSSTNENTQRQEIHPKESSRRFLPLEMYQLKQYHQFVIDQLYIGLQCTNCSLRFPNESDLGKKSRYSRHLDWHFRQNRREKAKPDFGSAVVAHRRPWYYSIDQWILYKEVNDDIEEDNSAFFESNSANSPNGNNKSNNFNLNFVAFKDSITDFDLFIETISCDNSGTTNSANNEKETTICSVMADSDVTSNCTVCNEPFDIKWFEDEEEWRLMNAVCYITTNSVDASTGRNFHPLCLKDYLLQQLDKQEQQSQNSELDESNNNLSISSSISDTSISRVVSSMIPGLDTPLKEEDDLIKVKTEVDDVEMENNNQVDIEQQDGQQSADVGEKKVELSNVVESKLEELEMESFEVKIEEFEIPIVTHVPQPQPTMKVVDDENKPSEASSNTIYQQNSQQQQQKPKRGLIVLKMKNSSSLLATTTSFSNDDNQQQQQSSNGNVLASNDNNSRNAVGNDEPKVTKTTNTDDTETGVDTTTTSDDNKQNENDDLSNNKGIVHVHISDNTDTDDGCIDTTATTDVKQSQVDDTNIGVASDSSFSNQQSIECDVATSGDSGERNKWSHDGEEGIKSEDGTNMDTSTTLNQQEQDQSSNYYSRGNEISSLCTVM